MVLFKCDNFLFIQTDRTFCIICCFFSWLRRRIFCYSIVLKLYAMLTPIRSYKKQTSHSTVRCSIVSSLYVSQFISPVQTRLLNSIIHHKLWYLALASGAREKRQNPKQVVAEPDHCTTLTRRELLEHVSCSSVPEELSDTGHRGEWSTRASQSLGARE